MSIRILDPLQLLPSQSGLVDPPLREGAASGASGLDEKQRALTIGEPVPIVFTRRVDGVGGVLVSPGATEARYENDNTTNELTVNLMLVLSEGELPAIPYKDVFQRACRVGTWAQTYDRKAGTWTPGNAIVEVAGKEFWNCPYYCGTSGRYENMTTLSYTNTHADGDTTWDKQVHVFVRNGMKVTRILDDTLGPSNNVIDLALYLIRESSRFPEDMLDLTQMEEAANFCQANGFFYNGEFKDSINLEEWLETIGNDFLLRKGDKNGKMGFRPRLPIAGDYTISTDPVSFVFTFTENHLLPDGFEIEYIPLADRRPICAQVLWRQQPDDDLGLIRTAEVRYDGEAIDGPFEQYDLSGFCASENHAVKVGAYRISRRAHITHTLRIKVSPGVYNGTLALGDIVRVRLRRETAIDQVSYHDYLYEVERIERTASGVNVLDLMHFPIDSTGASIVAKEVAAATGQGVLYATGRSDFTCDETGRRDDETPLPDIGTDPTGDNDDEVPMGRTGGGTGGDGGGGAPPYTPPDNPEDPLDEPVDAPGVINDDRALPTDPLQPGITLTVPGSAVPCADGQVCWYRRDKTTGIRTLIKCVPLSGGEFTLSITTDEIDYIIEAEGECPGSEPFPIDETDNIVFPDFNDYNYVRWTGSITKGYPDSTSVVQYTSDWVASSNTSPVGVNGVVVVAFTCDPIESEANSVLPTYSVPWRATVSAKKTGVYVFGNYRIGSFGNPCGFFPNGPTTNLNSAKYVLISGSWQFSDDQEIIEFEWTGDTSDSGPEVP